MDDTSLGATPTLTEADLALGESLFQGRADLAFQFHALLCTTGVDHGLVGPREVPIMWMRHVVNCAAVADIARGSGDIVDVGSGAGLPGLVLAIALPEQSVTLVEPMERRCTWLRNAVDELGLTNVTIVNSRAEDAAASVSGDFVTARAVAGLSKLLPWMAGVGKPGATIAAIKGESVLNEVRAAMKVVRKLKIEDVEIIHCGTGVVEPPTTVVRAKLARSTV